MSNERRKVFEDDGDVAFDERKETKKPKQYKVVLHNDNYTTMEFVVLVLMKFFRKSQTEAEHVMLTVHHKGTGVAGVYTKDVAETKVEEVTAFSREHGMPLRLTAEPTT